jgi:hypothetical protein
MRCVGLGGRSGARSLRRTKGPCKASFTDYRLRDHDPASGPQGPNPVNDETDLYLSKARGGELDAAFHSLIELRDDFLDDLEAAYHVEPDPLIRSLLVQALWQRRLY